MIFEPLDFNSKHRIHVTPAMRGKGRRRHEDGDMMPEHYHRAMTWAQRLKCVQY
jgi:hypothetical protein